MPSFATKRLAPKRLAKHLGIKSLTIVLASILAGSAYLVALAVIHSLVPTLEPAKLGEPA